MKSTNTEFPFDFYLDYLLKNRVKKKTFLKFSNQVFKIIEKLKMKKI